MAESLSRVVPDSGHGVSWESPELETVDALPITEKMEWSGTITAVQPRIGLTRSFDQRSHAYLGYILNIAGVVGGEHGNFRIAIGSGAHDRHQFRTGDQVQGLGVRVADPRLETAEIYKVSKLKLIRRGDESLPIPPPWHGVPPPLEVYRQRGHRRLATGTYDAKCSNCLWGCVMPVEMIIDQWNPERRRYRTETFCYGPLSCPNYKPGPTRKVPGRHGMSYEEKDWVDQDATAHRGPNE
jgi:hypothetical protein